MPFSIRSTSKPCLQIIELFAVLGLFQLIASQPGKGNRSKLVYHHWSVYGAAYKIIPGVVKLINLGTGKGLQRRNGTKYSKASVRSVSTRGRDSRSIKSVSLEGNRIFLCRQKGSLGYSTPAGPRRLPGDHRRIGEGKRPANLLTGLQDPAYPPDPYQWQPIVPGNMFQYWPAMAYVKQQPFGSRHRTEQYCSRARKN